MIRSTSGKSRGSGDVIIHTVTRIIEMSCYTILILLHPTFLPYDPFAVLNSFRKKMSGCQSLLLPLQGYLSSCLIIWNLQKEQHIYYDVSNQGDVTTFSFINLSNSALHVSGDKFTHLQEHVSTYIQLLVQCTDNAADRCHRSAAVSVYCTKSCIYSQNVLLRLGEFVVRNRKGRNKKINKWKSCCILLVAYIVGIK